ncbi:MAG TPA: urate oxidase [Candidatus Acidoferrum sp.]|nr:urate oxidase [Candidatus Acidoferrum sp.]
MTITLGENRYGKSRVRLMRVKRENGRHDLHEWTLEVLLQGDFESCFTEGDNSKILPTDTMKNTVYSLARKSQAASMEGFAKEMIDFLLSRNPQVSHASIRVTQKAWERLTVAGKPHPTTFVQSSGERQTTKVERARNGKFSVASGLENLIILKTAKSGFEGYIQDSLTTLAPTSDRLFGTALRATWDYRSADADFEKLREKIREILLAVFAEHDSRSVQHTLYAMGEAVLNGVAEVSEIELTMPNIHCLLVDLSRFGQDNPNEIFVPTDEPHGYIEARVRRQG